VYIKKQKKKIQTHAVYAIRTLDGRPSIFKGDKFIFSSERMLHKDYDRRVQLKKNLWSWVSRGLTPRRIDWRQTTSHKVNFEWPTILTTAAPAK
jgi:hypothetical protein